MEVKSKLSHKTEDVEGRRGNEEKPKFREEFGFSRTLQVVVWCKSRMREK